MRNRFLYWPPWGVTRPWWPTFFRGCDEWHNKSIAVGLPFTGVLIFFWEQEFSRDGEEHLHAHGPDGWEGADVAGCQVCQEIKRDIIELDQHRDNR